jgi:hypothetical protein
MKSSRRQFLRMATGAAALPVMSRLARAQTYPSRPITMVVTFPAGSAMDTSGRVMAESMRRSLGQPVIIENVSGGNGSIGAGHVARSAPDGYTLVLGLWNTHVANGALYALQYDLLMDFEPISLLVKVPYFIVAKKALPADDLREFIGWLKANPDAGCRKRTACRRRTIPKSYRHPISVRTLSQRLAADAGFSARTYRLDNCITGRRHTSIALEKDQGLRSYCPEPHCSRTGCSDG